MTVLLQYETVRWVLWIGGSVLLLYFAAKMVHSAIYHNALLAEAGEVRGNSPRQEFSAGSSWPCHPPAPSSGLPRWADAHRPLRGGTMLSSALFLGGFLCAGLLWSAGLCLAATQGGKLLGDKLLRYSYWASAAIFCYFAVYVIVSGYNEFVGKTAAVVLPGL